MEAPEVTILNVSTYKISTMPGKDRCLASFKFDRPVQAWSVNVFGISHDTGTVAEQMTRYVKDMKDMTVGEAAIRSVQELRQIDAEVTLIAEIDWTELYQEGENRVNIYGKSLQGVWTPYDA